LNKKKIILMVFNVCLVMLTAVMMVGCGQDHVTTYRSGGEGAAWCIGFGRAAIEIPEDDSQPYYMAGYNSGMEPDGVFDLCNASAVWMDTGNDGVLLIGVDCVGLSNVMVETIRQRLESFCKETGCSAVNVYSTHTHAGIDTLGLWGPVMVNGKNDEYSENVIDAAVAAAGQAYENRITGTLHLGSVNTEEEIKNFLRDSRLPMVYDPNLYQLRFDPLDESAVGIRMYLYGAHAESLRSDNSYVSRDFPGVMCDLIEAETGDQVMFMPGAIGGLIMTEVLDKSSYPNNMKLTGELLSQYALSITPEEEQTIEPILQYAATDFTISLDNTGFVLYRFLGVLENEAKYTGKSATGYEMESEMTLLQLGDVTFCLMPGEIFPELVWGGEYGHANSDGVNPQPLAEIAAGYGFEQLLIIGLANDEIGYIVPPSDFLLNEDVPYLTKTMDYKFENHYEETNSMGPETANVIAENFEKLCDALED